MTYSEIYEAIWEMDHPNIGKVKDISTEELKAWRIIDLLNGRAGFDDWWGNVDDFCQDEIFEGIVNLLKE